MTRYSIGDILQHDFVLGGVELYLIEGIEICEDQPLNSRYHTRQLSNGMTRNVYCDIMDCRENVYKVA